MSATPTSSSVRWPSAPFRGAAWAENTPYKIDTLLYVGPAKAMKAYLRKNAEAAWGSQPASDEVDLGAVDGLTVDCERGDGSHFIMVWMPRFDCWNAQDLGVFVHEVVHASVMVLKLSGVHSVILEGADEDESDDETLAHTADHMAEVLMGKVYRKCFATSRKSGSGRGKSPKSA